MCCSSRASAVSGKALYCVCKLMQLSVWDFHAGSVHTFSYEALSSGKAAQSPRSRSCNWHGSYRRWSSLVTSRLWNLNFSGWIAKKNSIAGACWQKAPEVFTWAKISSSWTKETSSITSSMLNKQLRVSSEEPVKAILQATLFLRPVRLWQSTDLIKARSGASERDQKLCFFEHLRMKEPSDRFEWHRLPQLRNREASVLTETQENQRDKPFISDLIKSCFFGIKQNLWQSSTTSHDSSGQGTHFCVRDIEIFRPLPRLLWTGIRTTSWLGLHGVPAAGYLQWRRLATPATSHQRLVKNIQLFWSRGNL